MARGRKIGLDMLEEKIHKAEQDVTKAKARYEEATADLKRLLDKRDALHMEQIISAIAKSDKSFDEIMCYINSTAVVDE